MNDALIDKICEIHHAQNKAYVWSIMDKLTNDETFVIAEFIRDNSTVNDSVGFCADAVHQSLQFDHTFTNRQKAKILSIAAAEIDSLVSNTYMPKSREIDATSTHIKLD